MRKPRSLLVLTALTGCATEPEPGAWDPTPSDRPAASLDRPTIDGAWVAAVQRRADTSYDLVAGERGAQADNAAGGFVAAFDADGARLFPDRGDLPFALRLVGFGREGALAAPSAGVVEARGNAVELRRDDLVEWYVNGPLGLEQGFTVPRAPAGAGRLALAVDVGPGWGARHGRGLGWERGGHAVRIGYAAAWDEDGHALPVELAARPGGYALYVDDRGAHGAITVDPLVSLEDPLDADETDDRDEYGTAVAIEGDVAVVGAPSADTPKGKTGAVYVFRRGTSGWAADAVVTAPDGAANDRFGRSVALSKTTLVVGAPDDDDKGARSGAVYVFTYAGGAWSQEAKLVPSDGAGGDGFGAAVGVDGDVLAGSAPEDDGQGSVYAYDRVGTTWNLQGKLVPVDAAADKEFGEVVSVSGTTVAVSAGGDDQKGRDAGAAYVFVRVGTTWNQQAKLTVPETEKGDKLGASVALDGDTLAVGVPGDDEAASGAGAIWTFTRASGLWKSEAKLKAVQSAASDQLGTTLDLDDDLLVAGLPKGSDAGTNSGAAYVFRRVLGSWRQAERITAGTAAQGDEFGAAVGVSGQWAVVGAPGRDEGGLSAGGGYVYWLDPAPTVDMNGAANGLDYLGTHAPGQQTPAAHATAIVDDWDTARISQLTVRIVNPKDGGSERLVAAPSGGVKVTWDATKHLLLLENYAEEVVYRDLLRAVRFEDTAASPDTTARVIEAVASDGTNQSPKARSTLTWTAKNAAPDLDLWRDPGDDWRAVYRHGIAPVTVADVLSTITDTDNTHLVSLVVKPENPKPGDLLTPPALGPAFTVDLSGGVLTVSGSAPLTSYENVLRRITFENTLSSPDATTRTFTITASDGEKTDAATSTITFGSKDVAPSVDLNGADPGTGHAGAFVEDGGPVEIVDSDPTLTDPDNGNLVRINAKIVTAYDGGLEVLAADTTGTKINASWNATTATLTLAGNDSLARYAQVLSTLTYDNASNDPNATPRIVRVTANDGVLDSAPAETTVSVRRTNDPPVVDLNGAADGVDFATTFAENGAAVAARGAGASVTDVDNASLLSLEAVLGAPRPTEVLACDVTGTPITASYADGRLELKGPASAEKFQLVLQTVTYRDTGDDLTETTREISFRAFDAAGPGPIAKTVVAWKPENDAPVLTLGGTLTWTEGDGPLVVDGGGAVRDPDGEDLDGAKLTVRVTGGGGPDDRLALGGDVSVTGAEVSVGGAAVGTVSGGVGVDPLVVAFAVAKRTQVEAVLRGVTFEVASEDPSADPRTVTAALEDGDGGASGPASATVEVTPVNDPPVWDEATPEGVVPAIEGTKLVFTVRAADPDDAPTYGADGLPTGATLDAATGAFAWKPLWSDAGAHPITLWATDGAERIERAVTLEAAWLDADADGLPDTWERGAGLSDRYVDSDDDGLSDLDEVGDFTAPADTDGDGVIDALDLDSDGDGIDDDDEAGDADPATPPLDTDGDGLPDWRDTDSDDDGHEDGEDNCRLHANADQADADADGAGDVCDFDTDNDGLDDEVEVALGTDPFSTDSDGDTLADGAEVGDPDDPYDRDGDGTIDALDDDSDGDGLPDALEAGDDDPSTPPVDTDGDGTPDVHDLDSDDDGVPDADDNCALVANVEQLDADGDGEGDRCDGDIDGDGVPNADDLCERAADPDQHDADGDGRGDACDPDDDDDGVSDGNDNCPLHPNADQKDGDKNGAGDACDPDGAGCGCATGAPGPAWALALGALALARRRR